MLVDGIHIRYALAWLNLGAIALVPVLVTLIQLRVAIDEHSFEPNCLAGMAAAQQLPTILQAYALQEVQVAADNLRRCLLAGIGALEGTLVWFIGIYKSTYRCLLGLAVNGALSVVSMVAEPVQSTAEHILQGIGLNSTAVTTPSWMSGLTSVQDKVQGWANGTSDPLDQLVRAPFEAIKTQIDRDLGLYKAPASVLVEPPISETMTQLSTCEYPPVLTDVLNSTRSRLLFLINILLAVVALLLVATVLIKILCIRSQHRATQRWTHHTAQDIEALKATDDVLKHKLTDLGLAYRRPWLASLVRRRSQPAGNLLRNSWMHAFTYPPVLYCLAMGVTGLFFTWLIGQIAGGAQDQLQDAIQTTVQQHFSGNNTDRMAIMSDQLDALNTWLAHTEADLNKHAFGTLQSIALTANTTLGVVTDHISEFLKSTLGGTLFEAPLRDVLDCLVMNKIDTIEQGLTWISEQSHVNLTRLDPKQVRAIILDGALLQGLEQPISTIRTSFDRTIKNTIQVHEGFYKILLLLWFTSVVIVILLHLSVYLKSRINK